MVTAMMRSPASPATVPPVVEGGHNTGHQEATADAVANAGGGRQGEGVFRLVGDVRAETGPGPEGDIVKSGAVGIGALGTKAINAGMDQPGESLGEGLGIQTQLPQGNIRASLYFRPRNISPFCKRSLLW